MGEAGRRGRKEEKVRSSPEILRGHTEGSRLFVKGLHKTHKSLL